MNNVSRDRPWGIQCSSCSTAIYWCNVVTHLQIHTHYHVGSPFSVQHTQPAALDGILTLILTQNSEHYTNTTQASLASTDLTSSGGTLVLPISGMFTTGPARWTQAEAEGQAVHPPAWPRVRSLSPDRPHRLLPPCLGLIQA